MSEVDPWRAVYEEHLDDIERVVSWTARRSCLVGDRADDFRSWVHVKLIDGDYRVFRRHRGEGGLGTYLVAVVQNLARDYQQKEWGRWRPSAAAERLGVAAVQLETLTEREGFSLDVATEMLRRHHGVRLSASEIADLAGRLPRREKVAVEGGERIDTLPGAERSDERLKRSEGDATMNKARTALQQGLEQLELEDRLILKMHYESGLPLAAIARALGLAQRQLYTRRDRALRRLRRDLESRGLDSDVVFAGLRWSGEERKLDFGVALAEGDDLEPSNRTEATPPPT